MNSHESNCDSSNEWHQNLLEGCNEIKNRLTLVVEMLSTSRLVNVPVSRSLRLVGHLNEANLTAESSTCR